MSSYEEKLSVLSEMIDFAMVNNSITDSEYNFLLSVANHLHVNQDDFDDLFDRKALHVVPKTQADRILQFHRLVLLMNIDRSQDASEINELRNIGLKMGLPPSAIEQVLTVMHDYPDKVIPPDVLIEIFKAHYN